MRIAARGTTAEKPVLVLGHYDTVHPVGTVERNKLRVEGEKLFGPGSYDMKAGAYLALRAMAALNREAPPVRGVELLLRHFVLGDERLQALDVLGQLGGGGLPLAPTGFRRRDLRLGGLHLGGGGLGLG